MTRNKKPATRRSASSPTHAPPAPRPGRRPLAGPRPHPLATTAGNAATLGPPSHVRSAALRAGHTSAAPALGRSQVCPLVRCRLTHWSGHEGDELLSGQVAQVAVAGRQSDLRAASGGDVPAGQRRGGPRIARPPRDLVPQLPCKETSAVARHDDRQELSTLPERGLSYWTDWPPGLSMGRVTRGRRGLGGATVWPSAALPEVGEACHRRRVQAGRTAARRGPVTREARTQRKAGVR